MPITPPDASRDPIAALLELMAVLRHPEQGCPWDKQQTFASIAPHTLEEAYEVVDAINRGDMRELREELGDLLFQVIYHARLAEEAGYFDFYDVTRDLLEKMVGRHPHVFGDVHYEDETALKAGWEARKAAERAAKGPPGQAPSALDGVALALPALIRSVKLQKRAAQQGFDWPDAEAVFAKINEELAELRAGIAAGDQANIEEEVGDLLFAVTNLARKLGVDPEAALRASNDKFVRRYREMEALAAERKVNMANLSLDEQVAIYQAARARIQAGKV